MKFAEARAARRIWAGKGVPGFARPAFQQSARLKSRGAQRLICLARIASNRCCFSGLKRGQTIRFSDSLDASYFEQLCSERLDHENGCAAVLNDGSSASPASVRKLWIVLVMAYCGAAGFGAQSRRARRGIEAASRECNAAASHAIEVAGTGERLARSLEWPKCRSRFGNVSV